MNSKKLFHVLFVAAAFLVVVTFLLLGIDFFQASGNFPTYTYIGKINVSGLDKNQALEKLKALPASAIFAGIVSFEAENRQYGFSPEAIGISIDLPSSVSLAFEQTHDEGYLKELKNRLSQGRLVCVPVFNINDDLLRRVIESAADGIKSTAKDASLLINEDTGGYHIEKEDLGREIDVDATLKTIKSRIAQGKKVFPLVIKYEYPRVTAELLQRAPPVYRLSAYTTYYGKHDSPNRIHNIRLIASWLDGTIILSGETYSLSDAIGDFTPDRGFKEAFVIFGGILVPQLGGGTCQIGTTLYNALSLADIKITERSNHSMYFNIYPLGRDAAVYPGQRDLKFVNDTGHPIMIKAMATNLRLSFRVYGTPTGKTVKFSNPAVFMLTPRGYRPASARAVLAADAPFKTIVTRTVYDSKGKKIKEEPLYSSYKLYGEKTNVPIARPEPR